MAEEKKYPLSIVVKTVDKATAKIRKINERINGATAPVRKLNNSFRAMSREAGLPKIARGFRGVGREAGKVLKKVGLLGAGLAALSFHEVMSFADHEDKLIKTAQTLGVTTDHLVQLRYAADKAGIGAKVFDKQFQTVAAHLGEAKANTGQIVTYLKRSDPALLHRLQHTKSNVQALYALSDAMKRIKDPTKRAAFAAEAFSIRGEGMINMLSQGSGALKAMMAQGAHFAGSQKQAAQDSARFKNALTDLSAAVMGAKSAVAGGLLPILTKLTEKLAKFIAKIRPKIAVWAKDFSKRLPKALKTLSSKFKAFVGFIRPVWKAIGGFRGALVLLATFMAGKLIFAIKSLSTALVTNPVGAILTGIAFAATEIITHWSGISAAFKKIWNAVADVFKYAWKHYIKPIVDKVEGAVDDVISAVHKIEHPFGGGAKKQTSNFNSFGYFVQGFTRQLNESLRGTQVLGQLRPISSPQPTRPTHPLVAAYERRRLTASAEPRSHGSVHVYVHHGRGDHAELGSDARGVDLTSHVDLSTGPMTP